MNETEECLTPEFGRASEALRWTSMAVIVLNVFTVVSGVVLWGVYRKNLFLSRRNPIVTFLFIFPTISNLLTGPLYRWKLNERSLASQCEMGNFTFVLVVPCLLLPNAVKIMSFHYRAKLHTILSTLHAVRQEEAEIESKQRRQTEAQSEIFGGRYPSFMSPSKNPVLFKYNSVFDDTTTYTSDVEFKNVNSHRFKAGSKFSNFVAFFLLALILVSSSIYTMFTCPNSFQKNCFIGFSTNATFLLAMLPILFLIALYIYFGYLSRRIPDPFQIKLEIKQFIKFTIAAAIITVVGFYSPGVDTSEDGIINFRYAQLIDLIIISIFVHAVHYQVFKSVIQERDIDFKYAPVSFEQILEHPEGIKLFETFLQSVFAVDSLKAWQILTCWRDDYHNDSNPERKLTQARNIYRRWLDPDEKNMTSIKVNVSYTCLKTLKKNLDDPKSGVKIDLFDEIIAELRLLLMSDCFSRFIMTEEYSVFVGTQDPKVEDNL